MTRIVILFVAATFLAACEAKLEGPSVKLGTSKLHYYSGSHGCPPGLAKQGRC